MPVSNEIVTLLASSSRGNATFTPLVDFANVERGWIRLSCTILGATSLVVTLAYTDSEANEEVTLLTWTTVTGSGFEYKELPTVVPENAFFRFAHTGGTNTSTCSITGILRREY